MGSLEDRFIRMFDEAAAPLPESGEQEEDVHIERVCGGSLCVHVLCSMFQIVSTSYRYFIYVPQEIGEKIGYDVGIKNLIVIVVVHYPFYDAIIPFIAHLRKSSMTKGWFLNLGLAPSQILHKLRKYYTRIYACITEPLDAGGRPGAYAAKIAEEISDVVDGIERMMKRLLGIGTPKISIIG